MDTVSAQGSGCSRPSVRAGATPLGSGRKLTERVLHEEFFEGLGTEVFEDSPLAFLPGIVQGAWGTFSTSAVFHNAAGDAEGSFHGFYGFPKRYPSRGLCQPGAPAAAMFAFDQPCAG